MKSLSVTIQMKVTEHNFPVVLFSMLYKVVLTFESVDEILVLTIRVKVIRNTLSSLFHSLFLSVIPIVQGMCI